jgi:hypothetical protein
MGCKGRLLRTLSAVCNRCGGLPARVLFKQLKSGRRSAAGRTKFAGHCEKVNVMSGIGCDRYKSLKMHKSRKHSPVCWDSVKDQLVFCPCRRDSRRWGDREVRGNDNRPVRERRAWVDNSRMGEYKISSQLHPQCPECSTKRSLAPLK